MDSQNNKVSTTCSDGDWSAFQVLVDNGANVKYINQYGDTLLHYASHGGNLQIVQYLVGKGLDINKRNKSGDLPIHYASREGGYLEVIEYFVSLGIDVNVKSQSGWSNILCIAKRTFKYCAILC